MDASASSVTAEAYAKLSESLKKMGSSQAVHRLSSVRDKRSPSASPGQGSLKGQTDAEDINWRLIQTIERLDRLYERVDHVERRDLNKVTDLVEELVASHKESQQRVIDSLLEQVADLEDAKMKSDIETRLALKEVELTLKTEVVETSKELEQRMEDDREAQEGAIKVTAKHIAEQGDSLRDLEQKVGPGFHVARQEIVFQVKEELKDYLEKVMMQNQADLRQELLDRIASIETRTKQQERLASKETPNFQGQIDEMNSKLNVLQDVNNQLLTKMYQGEEEVRQSTEERLLLMAKLETERKQNEKGESILKAMQQELERSRSAVEKANAERENVFEALDALKSEKAHVEDRLLETTVKFEQDKMETEKVVKDKEAELKMVRDAHARLSEELKAGEFDKTEEVAKLRAARDEQMQELSDKNYDLLSKLALEERSRLKAEKEASEKLDKMKELELRARELEESLRREQESTRRVEEDKRRHEEDQTKLRKRMQQLQLRLENEEKAKKQAQKEASSMAERMKVLRKMNAQLNKKLETQEQVSDGLDDY